MTNAPYYLLESGFVFVESNGPDSVFWRGVINRPKEYRPTVIPSRKLFRPVVGKNYYSREPQGVSRELR